MYLKDKEGRIHEMGKTSKEEEECTIIRRIGKNERENHGRKEKII